MSVNRYVRAGVFVMVFLLTIYADIQLWASELNSIYKYIFMPILPGIALVFWFAMKKAGSPRQETGENVPESFFDGEQPKSPLESISKISKPTQQSIEIPKALTIPVRYNADFDGEIWVNNLRVDISTLKQVPLIRPEEKKPENVGGER